jgi:hypothetical protein
MEINPDKSKAVSFTKARAEDLYYFWGDQKISELSCKYLGI